MRGLTDVTKMDVLGAYLMNPGPLLWDIAKGMDQPVFPEAPPSPNGAPSNPSAAPSSPTTSSWKLVALGGGLAVAVIAGAIVYFKVRSITQ